MDVTQRKHFEDALLKSENIFRNYFELGQVGMCITSLDQKWLNVNRRLCEMLGYSKEELTQLMWVELTHPDDLEADIGQFRRLLAGEIERYSMDKRFINKDGNVIYTHLTVACQRRPDKSVEYTIASVVDITERKQIENLLKKNQKLTQDIIDGTSSLIYALDKEGKFLFANKKFTSLFDVDHNYLIGKGRECLGMPEHIAREHRANDLIIMNSHDAVLFEESNDEADGTHVYASQKFPLLDTQGQIDGVCGISTDITDHKKYEEKILSSNAELEQFSYAVSHDMRQPLRMISSYLQLLEIKLADQLDGEKREYFDYAIEGAKRIDQMLMALLEYSRVGRQGEPPTLIDSRAVLDEALLFLQPAIKEAQANLNISGDWVQIFASHDEMVRLFQNLIGNATKYRIAGRTPEITITGEVINNQWHLCVADNGVGIIPNQINRLFKVFQRLHSHAAYEGTGIGLALCRKIVEHHKGRIWAESEGEGHGSKFCIALPVLRGED
jgi:PAS domain S-box-containing protein